MRRLAIGDRILRVRDEGEGDPPLVCIHGAGGSSVTFMDLVRRAQSARRIVALDLPGHGQSDGWHEVDAAQRIELYRDAVGTAAATLGISRAILVGHSMGGQVALACAAAWPERVAGLVLVASGARLPVSASLLRRAAEAPHSLAEWLVRAGFSPSTPVEIAERFAQLAFANALEGGTIAGDDFAAVAAFDGRPLLPKISCPTLVIAGRDDKMVPPELAAEVAAAIPGALYELIPHAGHMVLCEQPAAVWQRLRTFVLDGK